MTWQTVRASAGASLACSLVLVGCSHEQEAARAELDKIEQACRNGQPDQAREIMLKAVETNREFQRAFDRSTAGGTDRTRINACGLVLTEISRTLRRR
jgi:hypothetical protein